MSSQHDEDAIIARLVPPVGVFVEIGIAAHENNTNALAKAGWTGHVVEKNPKRCAAYRRLGYRVTVHEMEVTPKNLPDIPLTPDLFSLDIDGHDYPVAEALLARGLRPSVVVLEYNKEFSGRQFMPWPGKTDKRGNFGASLGAWHELWEPLGYRFVGTDSSKTNCFFIQC